MQWSAWGVPADKAKGGSSPWVPGGNSRAGEDNCCAGHLAPLILSFFLSACPWLGTCWKQPIWTSACTYLGMQCVSIAKWEDQSPSSHMLLLEGSTMESGLLLLTKKQEESPAHIPLNRNFTTYIPIVSQSPNFKETKKCWDSDPRLLCCQQLTGHSQSR